MLVRPREVPPPGLSGGLPGATAKLLVERDGAVVELPGKVGGHRLRKGDRLTVLTQGGGGLGDAAERDPAALAHDVLTGKVTPEAARTVYASSGTSPST